MSASSATPWALNVYEEPIQDVKMEIPAEENMSPNLAISSFVQNPFRDISKAQACASRGYRPHSGKGMQVLLVFALCLAIPGLAAAQTGTAPSRITERMDESVRTVLRGNTHPLARPQYDQGAVADGQPIRRMLLLLQRSPEQDAALKQLVDEQQSKSSPNYHQWLTPREFGQQFGPSDADIQTVTNWLQSHGFQVARVSTGKTLIEFSGTAGQVRSAFNTEIHRYVVNGQEHLANNADPQIPTALAPVVAGPVSLHNFPKNALVHNLGVFRKNTTTGKVDPLYTYGACGDISPCNALGPGDFANIYNVAKLWTRGINGTKIDGTGQTIAIVGDSEICTATSPDFGTSYIGPNGNTFTCTQDDVAQFRTLFGLPPTPNSPKVILDGPDPGFNASETEGDLDVEWSGAVAKGATIDFVIAEGTEATFGTDLAAEYIVDNDLAPVLSESFGECEFFLGSGGEYFEADL
jgi:subtilase family serine protease